MSEDEVRLKIEELPRGTTPKFMEAILSPFAFSAEREANVLKNFERELTEIGTNRIVLLGTLEGLPASTVQLVLLNADNNPELANGTDIAHVHNLWTRKDLQRRGLADAMMSHCELLAKRRGIQLLTLGVDDYNSSAIALYKKIGYSTFAEEEGRNPQEKLFLMRKPL